MSEQAAKPTLGRFFQGSLIELVVERLEADAELLGGVGLVAGVAVEGVVDGLHFQVAERNRAGDARLCHRSQEPLHPSVLSLR